jgi:hypothetical protein
MSQLNVIQKPVGFELAQDRSLGSSWPTVIPTISEEPFFIGKSRKVPE